MRKHIVALLILALAVPFLQGQKGCAGGAITMPGEEGAQVEVDAGGSDLVIDEAADEVGEERMRGPSNIMKPPRQENVPLPAVNRTLCTQYVEMKELQAFIDFESLEIASMDQVIMEKFDDFVSGLGASLGLSMSPRELLAALDNACVVCDMARSANRGEEVSVSDSFDFSQCSGLLGIDVFDDRFILTEQIQTDLIVDENGFYRISENFSAAQLADNVVAFGTVEMLKAVANVSPAKNAFTLQYEEFAPSALFVSMDAQIAPGALQNNMFAVFTAVAQVNEYLAANIDDLKGASYRAALNFVEPIYAIAAAVFDGDTKLIASAVSADSYDALIQLISMPVSEGGVTRNAKTDMDVEEDSYLQSLQADLRTLAENLAELKVLEQEYIKNDQYDRLSKVQAEIASVEARIAELQKMIDNYNADK